MARRLRSVVPNAPKISKRMKMPKMPKMSGSMTKKYPTGMGMGSMSPMQMRDMPPKVMGTEHTSCPKC